MTWLSEKFLFLDLNNYYCSKALVTLKLISLLIWAFFALHIYKCRYLFFPCASYLKESKFTERTLDLKVRNPGSESQLCWCTAGGMKSVTSRGKRWILGGNWKPLQEMVLWPGLAGKSCQRGTALQMAALSPIILTQGKLICTREDNIACSEKIAGQQ